MMETWSQSQSSERKEKAEVDNDYNRRRLDGGDLILHREKKSPVRLFKFIIATASTFQAILSIIGSLLVH